MLCVGRLGADRRCASGSYDVLVGFEDMGMRQAAGPSPRNGVLRRGHMPAIFVDADASVVLSYRWSCVSSFRQTQWDVIASPGKEKGRP